ncbi:MAG TPA: AraC family transcriptional regulator [Aliidongia sp.]|uniref:AraC family transcriptional regulator n=1 Tax=Aliidongia sp. TaxID=1914230 RepID=UPI002DDCC3CF|nr:AraC family transcriptional regulator [Aliidongia sp.]HEV2678581.1 AraC family transcriptional regulator [Aliidongia sp.]
MQSDDEPLTSAEKARYWSVAEGGGTDLLAARYVTHSFGRHTHPAYTMAVVIAGGEQYRYRGATHRAAPDQIAFLNPDEPHDGSRADEDGWCYRVMYVPPDAFACLDPDRPHRPFFPESVVPDPELAAAFVAQHQTLAGLPSLAREESFVQLLAVIARRHGRGLPAPRPVGREPGPVARVQAYLDEHLAETVPLARLAAIAGLHPLSLIRAFRRIVGMPPHAYQTARRIARAQALLRRGAAPAAVAFDCGFADQSHLTRAFKRIVGVPPGLYRQGTFKTGQGIAP